MVELKGTGLAAVTVDKPARDSIDPDGPNDRASPDWSKQMSWVITIDRIAHAHRYNVATSPDRLWFVHTLGGWGIGLICHGAYAMGSGRFLGAAWQERMIREELDREKRRSP